MRLKQSTLLFIFALGSFTLNLAGNIASAQQQQFPRWRFEANGERQILPGNLLSGLDQHPRLLSGWEQGGTICYSFAKNFCALATFSMVQTSGTGKWREKSAAQDPRLAQLIAAGLPEPVTTGTLNVNARVFAGGINWTALRFHKFSLELMGAFGREWTSSKFKGVASNVIDPEDGEPLPDQPVTNLSKEAHWAVIAGPSLRYNFNGHWSLAAIARVNTGVTFGISPAFHW